jgi:protein CpxP
MKKLVMVCGLLLGAVSLTFAQDGTHKRMSAEDRAKRSTERLSERLKLTEDQKAKVTAIYAEQAAEMSKSRAAEADVQKARYAGMKAKMEANDAKIKALLTADQQKAYDEMKAERKAKMHKRGDKKAPGTTMKK